MILKQNMRSGKRQFSLIAFQILPGAAATGGQIFSFKPAEPSEKPDKLVRGGEAWVRTT